MKNLYRFYVGLCCAVLLLCVASLTSAADMTWTGKISDSMCGASHAGMGGKMSDHDCTVECVKMGAKYVFVSKGKVYQIANQKDADLSVHAGETVVLTGSMTGDTITVTKVAVAAAKPS
jgi:hypothetical protein